MERNNENKTKEEYIKNLLIDDIMKEIPKEKLQKPENLGSNKSNDEEEDEEDFDYQSPEICQRKPKQPSDNESKYEKKPIRADPKFKAGKMAGGFLNYHVNIDDTILRRTPTIRQLRTEEIKKYAPPPALTRQDSVGSSLGSSVGSYGSEEGQVRGNLGGIQPTLNFDLYKREFGTSHLHAQPKFLMNDHLQQLEMLGKRNFDDMEMNDSEVEFEDQGLDDSFMQFTGNDYEKSDNEYRGHDSFRGASTMSEPECEEEIGAGLLLKEVDSSPINKIILSIQEEDKNFGNQNSEADKLLSIGIKVLDSFKDLVLTEDVTMDLFNQFLSMLLTVFSAQKDRVFTKFTRISEALWCKFKSHMKIMIFTYLRYVKNVEKKCDEDRYPMSNTRKFCLAITLSVYSILFNCVKSNFQLEFMRNFIRDVRNTNKLLSIE